MASDPVVADLVQRTLQEGKAWAEAEFALTKAEAGEILRHYILGGVLAVVAFVFLIATVIAIAGVAVTGLAPYVGGLFISSIIVALALALITLVLALVTRHIFAKPITPRSMAAKSIWGVDGQGR